MLLEMYMACDGLNRVTCPNDYYALPHIYVAACGIIGEQLAEARKAKES